MFPKAQYDILKCLLMSKIFSLLSQRRSVTFKKLERENFVNFFTEK